MIGAKDQPEAEDVLAAKPPFMIDCFRSAGTVALALRPARRVERRDPPPEARR